MLEKKKSFSIHAFLVETGVLCLVIRCHCRCVFNHIPSSPAHVFMCTLPICMLCTCLSEGNYCEMMLNVVQKDAATELEI